MIYIASDHAGFELKNQLVQYLKEKGMEVEDVGPTIYDENDDYPDFIYPCASKVSLGQYGDKGIVIGGSGQGEAMVANKVKGVRAAVYYGSDQEVIKLSRRHNDANVLSFGARFVGSEEAKHAVDLWLATPFEGGRHQRRIDKISVIENSQK